MFNHIIFLNFNEPTIENAQKVKERFLEMPLIIDEIKGINVGVNEIPSERSCDLVLSLKFDNKEDMLLYQQNPFHLSICDFINTIKKSSYSVDYTD
ncbi:MAG: Dabb family protein [Clostridia bacterium]